MKPEVLNAGGGFYIPMSGAWQSEEDNAAFAEAERIFNELKETKDYVALVQSHHEYTHGYWVDVKKKEVKFPDHVLKEHQACV